MSCTVFKFGFGGWREPVPFEIKPQARPFRCPTCQRDVFAVNVLEIACDVCGEEGNKQNFSAVVKKAA